MRLFVIGLVLGSAGFLTAAEAPAVKPPAEKTPATPAAKAPAKAPAAKAPAAKAPAATAPAAKATAKTPEAKAPESKSPDAKTPDGKTSGGAVAATISPALLRQARQLIHQAEEQLAQHEPEAAAAIYEQVLERAAGSPAEFTAQLGLGRIRFAAGTFDKAIERFQRAAGRGAGVQADVNPDVNERAEALYHVGLCHVRLGQGDRCFPSFRAVTEVAPGSVWANRAFFEIGEAHLTAGSFTQAIANFRMVGASLDAAQAGSLRVDLGRPLVVQITDLDFLNLSEPKFPVDVISSDGDKERIILVPQVPGSPCFIGQVSTAPGSPRPDDGVLQAIGTSVITVLDVDEHTASGKLNVERNLKLSVSSDGQATITDGAFRDPVSQIAVDEGKGLLNLRVRDADQDLGNAADTIRAEVIVEVPVPSDDPAATGEAAEPKFKERNRISVSLVELAVSPDAIVVSESVKPKVPATPAGAVPAPAAAPGATPAAAALAAGDKPAVAPVAKAVGIHSGVFALTVPIIITAEGVVAPAGTVAAAIGDRVTLRYSDAKNLLGDTPIERSAMATVVPGDSASLSVAGSNLPDAELRVRKDLLLSETSLRLGEVYRDMGLEKHAQDRFNEALGACQRVVVERGVVDRQFRARTLHTLWSIYLAKGALDEAAQACRALQAEFPDSDLIDDSLLALGRAAQAANQEQQAERFYEQVAALPKGSALAAEGIYRIGQMHEAHIESVDREGEVQFNTAERGQAISAYRRVFTAYPDSTYAAESLRKLGDFYFAERNFIQAIDFFERTLREHPDAPFVADVLFNLGRSRYLKEDYTAAMQVVDRIQREFPGYERMDKTRALRKLIQQKLGNKK